MGEPSSEVALWLSAARNGDATAAERLMRAVYDRLHCIAHDRLAREDWRGDLQTTVLAQAACLRLLG